MNFEFLSRTFLFQGTSPEETQHMLSCLNAEPKSYPKGSVICQVGDQMKAMGLVLSGSVHIESIDDGKQNYSEPDRSGSGVWGNLRLHSRGKAAGRGDSCGGLPDFVP